MLNGKACIQENFFFLETFKPHKNSHLDLNSLKIGSRISLILSHLSFFKRGSSLQNRWFLSGFRRSTSTLLKSMPIHSLSGNLISRRNIPDVTSRAEERVRGRVVRHFSIGLCSSFVKMSGLGRYPLNIPSLSDAFANFQHGLSNSNQRRDRLDYDDRRFRDRDRDSRRDDDFRRDTGGSRGRSSRDRFSPEVSSILLNNNKSTLCKTGCKKLIILKSTCL